MPWIMNLSPKVEDFLLWFLNFHEREQSQSTGYKDEVSLTRIWISKQYLLSIELGSASSSKSFNLILKILDEFLLLMKNETHLLYFSNAKWFIPNMVESQIFFYQIQLVRSSWIQIHSNQKSAIFKYVIIWIFFYFYEWAFFLTIFKYLRQF